MLSLLDEYKQCSRCGDSKFLAEYIIGKKHVRIRGWCRACETERKRVWRSLQDPERKAMEHRRSRYGMSDETFEALKEKQNNQCAICGTNTPKGQFNTWHVDHDHSCCGSSKKTCGECTRGLLCQNCNAMIGYAKDDVRVLIDAIFYLLKHRKLHV